MILRLKNKKGSPNLGKDGVSMTNHSAKHFISGVSCIVASGLPKLHRIVGERILSTWNLSEFWMSFDMIVTGSEQRNDNQALNWHCFTAISWQIQKLRMMELQSRQKFFRSALVRSLVGYWGTPLKRSRNSCMDLAYKLSGNVNYQSAKCCSASPIMTEDSDLVKVLTCGTYQSQSGWCNTSPMVVSLHTYYVDYWPSLRTDVQW